MVESVAPFEHGYLDVGAGHQLYFTQYGRADAPAAVVLHGGPGSGCTPAMLDWFDLSRQRVVLFDQRGAGKSIPSGCVDQNCMDDLVDDIERLRIRLGIPRWLLVGGSWGALLALAYAARYPGAVAGVVLRGTFLASAREIRWFFQELRALVPFGWARMTTGWSLSQCESVLATLAAMLLNGTPDQRIDAARRWAAYERAVLDLMLGARTPTALREVEQVVAKYTVQAHYLSQGCLTSERTVFRLARKLKDIPVIVIHGTHDLVCPPENALRLMHFLPRAELRWIGKGTHTPSDPLIAGALSAAICELRNC
jgi:proline iminopeptidase